MEKKVVIVGAGPGGLTAGMILAKRGFQVEVFEKDPVVGGRNKGFKLGGYTFDTGPTFLMLLFILRDVFRNAGRNADDLLEFKRIDPLYRLQFAEKSFVPPQNPEKLKEEIARVFPGNESGLDRYFREEEKRFRNLFPCLQKDYSSFAEFLSPVFRKAIPHLAIGRTLFGNLGRYFSDSDLKIAFTFQSKYLGMSPWECPGLFTMLSYVEYAYGVYHVVGGLHRISEAMAKVIEEHGGKVHLSAPVREIDVENGKARGVVLASNDRISADTVVVNADFGYAATQLFRPGVLRKYNPRKIEKMGLSCATFMIYLGLKKKYDLNHHNIFFARDYRANIDSVFSYRPLGDDFSFYVQNACATDPSLAPTGGSTLYVLVPVSNNRGGFDWRAAEGEFRERVLNKLVERTGLTDLRENIEVERVITPREWETNYNVYRAAEFNLAHNLTQMLYFRPHNEMEDVDGCYLAGGGTHPGSGLPTIYESGRISANMISKRFGVDFDPPSGPPQADS